jgi:TM2 domain-containing membrane protein YozV
MKMKYCQHCGAQIASEAEICPKCGVRVAAPPQTTPSVTKNPGIAAVLSFLFVGLGQIYNGQIGKGVLFIILGVVCIGLAFFIIGLIAGPILWIYSIYDAYKTADKINRGLVKT